MEAPRPLDLDAVAHRPLPRPAGKPLLLFGWHGTAFLHWRVPAGEVRPHVPAGLALDTHGEDAWVSVVAFHLMRTRLRAGPRLAARRVPELNLRTYVTGPAGPGALFWRLDAPDPFVVLGGRAMGIPYRKARLELDRDGVEDRPVAGARLASGWSAGAATDPDPLDEFLHERYVLYAQVPGRRVVTAGVHHAPWPLRELEPWVEAWGDLAGMVPSVAGRPPDRARWSPGVEAACWRPRILPPPGAKG